MTGAESESEVKVWFRIRIRSDSDAQHCRCPCPFPLSMSMSGVHICVKCPCPFLVSMLMPGCPCVFACCPCPRPVSRVRVLCPCLCPCFVSGVRCPVSVSLSLVRLCVLVHVKTACSGIQTVYYKKISGTKIKISQCSKNTSFQVTQRPVW